MPSRPVVLLVEDDWTLRELYRLALSLSDFTVHACEDGMQALHYLDQENPDLVVLDLNLPRVPGQMVYDELRARTQTGIVPPIIVVTGMYNVPYLPGRHGAPQAGDGGRTGADHRRACWSATGANGCSFPVPIQSESSGSKRAPIASGCSSGVLDPPQPFMRNAIRAAAYAVNRRSSTSSWLKGIGCCRSIGAPATTGAWSSARQPTAAVPDAVV